MWADAPENTTRANRFGGFFVPSNLLDNAVERHYGFTYLYVDENAWMEDLVGKIRFALRKLCYIVCAWASREDALEHAKLDDKLPASEYLSLIHI